MTKRPEQLFLDRLATPIGEAMIVTDENGCLRALDWADCEGEMRRTLRKQYGMIGLDEPGPASRAVKTRLQNYFDGDIGCLGTIAWRTSGTPFQQSVWAALSTIAPGTTLSYGALAAKLGSPTSIRAVGRANGANPISIVVPCHRVIGTDGSLTGYGGGMKRKCWLLRHEGVVVKDGGSGNSRSGSNR